MPAGANEPTGFTAFYDWSPVTHGTDMDAPLGSGTGQRINQNTSPAERDWAGNTEIVADAGTASGSALQQNWPAGRTQLSGLFAWNWATHVPDNAVYPGWSGNAIGVLTELYVRCQFRTSDPWDAHSSAEKLLGFSMDDGNTNLDAFFVFTASQFRFRFQNNTNAGVDVATHRATAGVTSPYTAGTWADYEIHLVAQSAPGASDGEFHVWVDDTAVTQWTRLSDSQTHDGTGRQVLSASSPGTGFKAWNTMPFFRGGSDDAVVGAGNHLAFGELYMSANVAGSGGSPMPPRRISSTNVCTEVSDVSG